MKIKSLFLAVLVAFSSAVAFAGNEEPVRELAIVPVKNSDVFKVIYKASTAGRVKLNVYNASGTLLMSESIKTNSGFILPVNFKGLTSGEYSIELIDASGTKIQKVAYQADRAVKHIHISKLTGTQSRFLISVANSGSQVIDVKIYDANNQLLHAETTSVNGDFAKVYNLAKASSSYTFEITDEAGAIKTIKF
jgi:hypothetical protein